MQVYTVPPPTELGPPLRVPPPQDYEVSHWKV